MQGGSRFGAPLRTASVGALAIQVDGHSVKLRLPILDSNEQRSIDYDTLNKMVDLFMEKGFTYFDTSYIYHGGFSETALGKSLVDRYPRDSFLLSTKMPIKFMQKKE